MRTWCNRHPIGFMGCFLVFYLLFFFWLEHRHPVAELVIHCPLDDWIPFCKYAVIPYFLWFAWIPVSLLLWLRRAPRPEFWRLCLPLFAGMTLALTFCALVPNGVHLRPDEVPGQDLFAQAVRWLYRSDTDTNVFPSIHVFNAVTLDLAYQRSGLWQGRRRWVRPAARVLDLAVIASTLLLRQHSVLDAAGGIALALILDRLADRVSRRLTLPRPACRRRALSLKSIL